ncbi:MAG: Si-specific NAD(P)(+) transhydrogenase [Acidimicrobiia bacterium]|nr:Si-specific NAD(P)(+) transhydrogenase [Acidimicrobiia bacterium]
MTNGYDFVVIGSGPAGEKAAAMAAYFGKSVAIVERDPRPGGTVVSRGGIPTKTLREAAMYLSGFHRREVYGVGLDLSGNEVLEVLRARAHDVTERVADGVSRNLERHRIDYLHGSAAIVADGNVSVTDGTGAVRILEADKVLISTGSRPFRPGNVPFDDPAVDDSDSILALESIPRSLVVIGGGPVGTEYASIITALGSSVTLVDAGPRLIPFADEEISDQLAQALTADGTRFVFDSPGATITRTERGLEVGLPDGETLYPEKVLFAAGRAGNVEGLGLEEADIDTDDRNHILVDAHFQTTHHGIYAAGDVIGPPALASVSAEQGRIAASHAFGLHVVDRLDSLPTYGVYSMPEVGMVGMTEQAARASGMPYAIGRSWFKDNGRSRIAGTTTGLIKLVVGSEDHKLLGVHILGEDAAELVHIGQAAIHARDKVDRFVHTTFNTPTRSEAYKYAAYDALQDITGRRLQDG